MEFGEIFRESKLITDISKYEQKLFINIDNWFDDINKILIMTKELRQ